MNLVTAHLRMEWWIDEFVSTLELLTFCEDKLRKLQKRKLKILNEAHVKHTLPRMLGSPEEKEAAKKYGKRLRIRMAHLEQKAQGYREWSLVAAKVAALDLHDFGRAHDEIKWLLSNETGDRTVASLVESEKKTAAMMYFDDEFASVYSKIRHGVAHMHEKVSAEEKGLKRHGTKDRPMFGLSIKGRRLSTTWKGKVYSVMLDDSTVQKMEKLLRLWENALRNIADKLASTKKIRATRVVPVG